MPVGTIVKNLAGTLIINTKSSWLSSSGSRSSCSSCPTIISITNNMSAKSRRKTNFCCREKAASTNNRNSVTPSSSSSSPSPSPSTMCNNNSAIPLSSGLFSGIRGVTSSAFVTGRSSSLSSSPSTQIRSMKRQTRGSSSIASLYAATLLLVICSLSAVEEIIASTIIGYQCLN